MEQIRRQPHKPAPPAAEADPALPAAAIQTGALDGLLDEIDEVLEENAEAFVQSFVQKGGQ